MENTSNILLSPSSNSKKKHKPQTKQDISGYGDHQEPFNPVRGETAMWRAVITQALMDAASNSRKSEVQYHKREATTWLLGESEDFNTVCEYAGLDPCYVHRMAKLALSRGCQWRAPATPKSFADRRPASPPPMEFKSLLPMMFTPAPVLTSACA